MLSELIIALSDRFAHSTHSMCNVYARIGKRARTFELIFNNGCPHCSFTIEYLAAVMVAVIMASICIIYVRV